MFESITEQPAATVGLGRIVDRIAAHERLWLLAGLGFQMVVLVGMIVTRVMPHLTGDTVLVRVVPVDPRDLFRGDYVVLSYSFSRLPPHLPGLTPSNSRHEAIQNKGRTVYVSLVPEGDGVHYREGAFSLTPPSSGKFLRGTIQYQGRNDLEFGIESYYVQEGKGREWEDAIRAGQLWAEIAVAPDGQAALKGLRRQ